MPVIADPAVFEQGLHSPTELVAQAWIRTIPGLVCDGVAGQLPKDNQESWSENGFIVVPTTVGGSPHSAAPLRKPVCQVECWATNPESNSLPWGKANQLAEQILAGTYDRLSFGRPLAIRSGSVTYPTASVKSATCLTEPRRIWSDAGAFAGYQLDLLLIFVAQGEVIP